MPIKDPEKLKAARKRNDEKRKGLRTRGWATVAYPDSLAPGWVDKLREAHVQTLISPLHDKDVEGDGSPKPAHYHVLLMFEQPVPEASARQIFQAAGVGLAADGQARPAEMIKSVKGYARYLLHLDDPDKVRYDEKDIMELSGAKWRDVAYDATEEADLILDDIEDFIIASGLDNYFLLVRYARQSRRDWLHTIRHSSVHLKTLMQSLEHGVKTGLIDLGTMTDPATGECLIDVERPNALAATRPIVPTIAPAAPAPAMPAAAPVAVPEAES